MSKTFEYDVFLSYSSKDKEPVHALAERLRNDGLRVWLDKWEIKPGDLIPLKIQHGLEKSNTLLMCMSSAYFDSEWGKVEHNTLIFRDPTNLGRRLIPLLMDDCTPPDVIAQFAYIDWRKQSDEEYGKLVTACQGKGPEKAKLSQEEKKTDQTRMVMNSAGYVRDAAATPNGGEIVSDSSIVRISFSADVCPNGCKYSTIQAAIDDANPGGIITVAAGAYKERVYIDKSLTIKGAGVGKTIVDGGQVGSVFTVGKDIDKIKVFLLGMTIKGGVGTSVSVDDHDANKYICGGGILNYGRLTITDSNISGNKAHYGGGIFNKGTVNLNSGTSVTKNTAYNGGGIYGNRGSINLNGGSVTNNRAEQLGAGIYTGYGGSVKMSSVTISDNNAGNNGGGIYSQGGLVFLYGGKIFKNDAYTSGGGIFGYGCQTDLNGGAIYSNTARNGAGVVNGGGKMTLDGTIIHHNTASRNGNGVGGGIQNSGTLTLNSGSIEHNTALKDGGGIWNEIAGTVSGERQIVRNNTLVSGIPDDISPKA